MQELITVENLSFSYPDGQQALTDVSLGIYRGDSVAIVGPNGAGKSTLVLHFNGILRSNGHIKLMGKAVDENNLRWVRSRVGLVFQNPDDQLFSPTVFDDVAFGPMNMGYGEAEVEQAVKLSLELVGMAGFEKRSPHHLSVGEKKRIAMATVLSMSPEVLVIDEPTSNLDPRGKWDIIEDLKGLSVTKIVVSHDLEMVEALCRRMIIIDRGRVVADGATADTLADKQLLAEHGLAGRLVY
ncbi:MAG: ATP-binding cassette domain-containing protein [Dehalococcoidales bacterium]|nr:ATP-binding cassette domain-containing protein [Dehalococcoidales bacterium]